MRNHTYTTDHPSKMHQAILKYRQELHQLAEKGLLTGEKVYAVCQHFKRTFLSNDIRYKKEGRSKWIDQAEQNVLAAILGLNIVVTSRDLATQVANGSDLLAHQIPGNADSIAVRYNGIHYYRETSSDTPSDGKCGFHAIAARVSEKYSPSLTRSEKAQIQQAIENSLRDMPKKGDTVFAKAEQTELDQTIIADREAEKAFEEIEVELKLLNFTVDQLENLKGRVLVIAEEQNDDATADYLNNFLKHNDALSWNKESLIHALATVGAKVNPSIYDEIKTEFVRRQSEFDNYRQNISNGLGVFDTEPLNQQPTIISIGGP